MQAKATGDQFLFHTGKLVSIDLNKLETTEPLKMWG